MLNVNVTYPYPVIRPYVDDFATTTFEGELTVVPDGTGYKINPNFSVNNQEIEAMVLSGQLAFAIEIECTSTWLREIHVVNNNESFHIDTTKIHEAVDLTPCIVAARPISRYKNKDFSAEYEDIEFSLEAGDVVGIGQKKTFDAFYQSDIIKNGSPIITFVVGDDNLEILECKFSGPKIEITLPPKQFEAYWTSGLSKQKHKSLNAILSIPALVQAISIINEDYKNGESGDYSGCSWYKTIVANLKRYAENDEVKYIKCLENPFTSAELLLGNNSKFALVVLAETDLEGQK